MGYVLYLFLLFYIIGEVQEEVQEEVYFLFFTVLCYRVRGERCVNGSLYSEKRALKGWL